MNLTLLSKIIADNRAVSVTGISGNVSKRSHNDSSCRSRKLTCIIAEIPNDIRSGLELLVIYVPDLEF